MGYKCSVPGCKQGYDGMPNNPNISMHKFPDGKYDPSSYEEWMKALGALPFKRNKTFHPNTRICSLHFKPSDFVQTSVDTNNSRKAAEGRHNQPLKRK